MLLWRFPTGKYPLEQQIHRLNGDGTLDKGNDAGKYNYPKTPAFVQARYN
jgi:hypothetical protein